MTLVELLEKLRPHLDSRGDYSVVSGRRPRPDDQNAEDVSFHPIIAAFADDSSQEIILRTTETRIEQVPELDRMKLRDLLDVLDAQGNNRSAFDVETSSAGPEDEFRVDFPIAGTGWGDESQVFAMLW